MKTLDEALKYFASKIWEKGESKNGQCCLIPFSFNGGKELTIYEKASKIVCDNLKVTHFDRNWKKRGKTVILRFYKGDCLGACLDLRFTEERIVRIA